MNKSLSIVVGIFVILIMVLCLLAVNVNHSWIEFSTIFNGIMMPILTAINVYVFVKLTKVVSEKDEVRSRNELEYQKKMLLMQFRKNELDTFDRIITESFDFDNSHDSCEKNMFSAMVYVESFYSSKLSLYDLDKNSVVANEICEFLNSIIKIHNALNDRKEVENEKILNLLLQKKRIIQSLQKITFSC